MQNLLGSGPGPRGIIKYYSTNPSNTAFLLKNGSLYVSAEDVIFTVACVGSPLSMCIISDRSRRMVRINRSRWRLRLKGSSMIMPISNMPNRAQDTNTANGITPHRSSETIQKGRLRDQSVRKREVCRA